MFKRVIYINKEGALRWSWSWNDSVNKQKQTKRFVRKRENKHETTRVTIDQLSAMHATVQLHKYKYKTQSQTQRDREHESSIENSHSSFANSLD